VTIETTVLDGGGKRLPVLMQQSYARWLERRNWEQGW